jgi:NTE family protein
MGRFTEYVGTDGTRPAPYVDGIDFPMRLLESRTYCYKYLLQLYNEIKPSLENCVIDEVDMADVSSSQAKQSSPFASVSPATQVKTGSDHDSGVPKSGIGLCLSGGGFRAMLFHLGAIWRLNELGYLKKLDRISSVSGGSITAGVLAMKWDRLQFDTEGCAGNFVTEIVDPICAFAGRTVDLPAIFGGLLIPVQISRRVIAAYQKYLFGETRLQDLPDRPDFVFNATNVQSGVLWRFMKEYMADYRVGKVKKQDLPLAVAVAASSAFPPFLSPVFLQFQDEEYMQVSERDLQSGMDLHKPPFMNRVYLSDGGVYDNLGLETVWKKYDTVLISDGGGRMDDDSRPPTNWLGHILRVLNLIDNQVRALRKRQAIDSYKLYPYLKQAVANPDQAGILDGLREVARKGAYWGIWTDIANYKLKETLGCPHEKTQKIAETSTRLKALPAETQQRIINWGYAVCDAAMRKHVLDPELPAPANFPYPDVAVG